VSAIPWTTVEDAIQAWIVAGSGLAADHVIWSDQGGPRPVGQYVAMRVSILANRGRDWLDRVDKFITFADLTISSINVGADTFAIAGHGRVTGDGPMRIETSGGTAPADASGVLTGRDVWAIAVDANTVKLASTFQNAVAAVPVPIDVTSAGTGTNVLVDTPTTTRAGQEIEFRLRGPRRAVLELQCFGGAPTGTGPIGASSPTSLLHDAIASHALETRASALAAAGIGVAGFDEAKSIPEIVDVVRFEPRAVAAVRLHLASEIVETATYVQIVNVTNQIVTPEQTFPVRLA